MPKSPLTPPRLLLGFALVFWGLMTDQLAIGLPLAVAVEAAHWTRLRWDFQEQAFLRAWQLCALLISARMVLILIDGGRFIAVPRLLGWLPLLLAPLQLAQSYSLNDRMPLTIFSFFARRRMLRNLELGLPVRPIRINFGAVYLPLTVVSCTLGEHADNGFFLAGIVAITGWATISAGHRSRGATVLALLLAAGIALGGQAGLSALYSRLIKSGSGGDEENTLSHYRTEIGNRGEIKQSTQILWRLRTLQGRTPQLLHTALFNQYDRGIWSYRVPPEQFGKVSDFDDLKSIDAHDGQSYFLANANAGQEAVAADLPRFTLRGAARRNSALPVPGSITALSGFDFEGQSRNAIGTIRVFPDETISDGIIVWDGLSSPERAPWQDMLPGKPAFIPDLKIPRDEAAAVAEVVRDLGLKPMPLEQKLSVLKSWFASNFRYTRYLSIDANRPGNRDQNSALSRFLRKTRAGHCEYFATATTLILREAGVPARYAIGFAVSELDRGRQEAVIRGTHGHAWCRVWDEASQRWFDFDTTPASWVAEETQHSPWHQPLQDWLQRQREDFYLWRNQPGNGLLIGGFMSGIGLIGALFIGRRLWKSRRRVEQAGTPRWNGPAIRTPLHDLEPLASNLLGPRPAGTPLGPWFRKLPPLENLDEAIDLHQRLRFDPGPPSGSDHSRLADLTAKLRPLLQSLGRKHPRA